MKFVSLRTFFEVLAGIWLNLTSGWFGILLISPGLFGTVSPGGYIQLLTVNGPFGIVGLLITLWLFEKSKTL